MDPEEEIVDPIREILRKILDLTASMVAFYKENGLNEKALELILWVTTCLHAIIVEKKRIYIERAFTPEEVKMKYYATKTRALAKYRIGERSKFNSPFH